MPSIEKINKFKNQVQINPRICYTRKGGKSFHVKEEIFYRIALTPKWKPLNNNDFGMIASMLFYAKY